MALVLDAFHPRADEFRRAGYWSDATLGDWLAANERECGDREALRYAGKRLSWSQFGRQVRAFARGLDRLGIAKGDVVAVQLPNSVEFVTAYLAIASRGAVMQTLHMPYRAAELQTLLAHSKAVAAIVVAQAKDYSASQTVLDLKPALPHLKDVIAVGPSAAPGTTRGAIDFASLVADAESNTAAPAPVTVTADMPFLLLYTSGTTSAPKGVPHAYRNFLGNSRLSARELSVTREDLLLSAAPYTHLYGLFSFNMALATGAASLLMPAFSPPELAGLFSRERPTIAFTAPAHIAACLGAKLFDGLDLSSLKYVQISGTTVPPELGRAFEPLLPRGKVMQLWGMTELQAGAYTRLADSEPVRIETTGCASPGTELRVLRDDGSLAAPGEVGELQMRGASLFSGYLDNPQATRDAFTDDGWFRTGDLAVMDAAGNTALAGRTKDIINRGGVKFNPVDVENLMAGHPAVAEAAVVPMPDPVLGEKACLFVTLRPGASLQLDEVQRFLEERKVSKLKWPERLEIISAMPLTPTRKVIKGQLAKLFDIKKP